MKITAQQAQIGLLNYIENEIARKASGVQKFATYFLMLAYKEKVGNIIAGLKNNAMIAPLEIFDEQGYINIDVLHSTAKSAMQQSGQITISGIIFNESDIDKLYEYLKAAGV